MLSDSTPRLSVVGAGPGDPELLTLKGLKALQSAGAVLYDALVSEELLEYAPPEAMRIFVGKRRNFKKFTQDEINALIVEMALEHGHVVRLKGGDPFVFGRGYEEMEYAQSFGIPADYIPGISSSIAVPGLAGIPVTYRNLSRSFWVITATTSDGSLSPDIALAAQSDATAVILMGLAKLPEIAEIFRQAGKSDLPAAVLQNGSLPAAKNVFGTVDDIVQKVEKETLGTPAVIVLGEVVCDAASPTATMATRTNTDFSLRDFNGNADDTDFSLRDVNGNTDDTDDTDLHGYRARHPCAERAGKSV